MFRNLDITTLRSLIAVADSGGVTRAAGFLHLTQSAVSMQIKRLEELLDITLFERSGRQITPTPAGQQLLTYARKIVSLNDEAVGRLTCQSFEGTVKLGVPHDVIHPFIPRVLKRFHAIFPRVNVNLVDSNTRSLRGEFERGGFDLILTTESSLGEQGETIHELPLIWVGATNGTAARHRPVKLAFCRNCIFRQITVQALDDAGLSWEMVIDSDSDRSVEATISADLAIGVLLDGTQTQHQALIDHGGGLPQLPSQLINLYGADRPGPRYVQELAELIRQSFASGGNMKLRAAE